MARKHYAWQISKWIAGVALLVVSVVGLVYGSLLRGIDLAAKSYEGGDMEGALRQYETIEQRLRSLGSLRLIPAADRRNLILSEARLLYALGRYDDAIERMQRETDISGKANDDGRFKLLQGEIAFRKAVITYREASKKNPQALEEALRAAEEDFRDSLSKSPNDWDAKFNFEFVSRMRNQVNHSDQEQVNLLMKNVRVQEKQPEAIPSEKQG